MKIGLVGAGAIGQRRAEVVGEDESTEMEIVADVDEERARELAQRIRCRWTTDPSEVVNCDDVDAVIVSATPKFLSLISIAAMENGKHVLCEKPLGRNSKEVKEMWDAACTNGVRLKSGFNHRHHPGILKARELFEMGVIGELNFVRCRYGHGGRPGYEREWRADPQISGGGELIDQGVHALDLFRWFMGEFSQVVGFVSTRFWDISPLEDNAFALLKTDKDQIASLHASWTQWKNIFSFEIFGQDGYVIVDGLGGNYGAEKVTLGIRSKSSDPPKEEVLEFPGSDRSFSLEWEEFVTAIRDDRRMLADGYDGWQTMRLVDAVYESAEKGCVVEL